MRLLSSAAILVVAIFATTGFGLSSDVCVSRTQPSNALGEQLMREQDLMLALLAGGAVELRNSAAHVAPHCRARIDQSILHIEALLDSSARLKVALSRWNGGGHDTRAGYLTGKLHLIYQEEIRTWKTMHTDCQPGGVVRQSTTT